MDAQNTSDEPRRRPNRELTHSLFSRIGEQDWRRLKADADREELTVSDIVRRLIREHYDRCETAGV